jgi:lipoate-protein ligase A
MPAVLVDGKKLIGSAQRRGASWLLQHGSILLELDEALHREVFPAWPEDGRSHVTSLRAVLGRRPEPDELAATLAAAWAAVTGGPCLPGRLAAAERRTAERLAAERYAAAAWTWRR